MALSTQRGSGDLRLSNARVAGLRRPHGRAAVGPVEVVAGRCDHVENYIEHVTC